MSTSTCLFCKYVYLIASGVQGKLLPSTAPQWPWRLYCTILQWKNALEQGDVMQFPPNRSTSVLVMLLRHLTYRVIEIPGCLHFSSFSFSDLFGNARKWERTGITDKAATLGVVLVPEMCSLCRWL